MNAPRTHWLDVGRGDRILLALFAPLVTALVGAFAWGCHLWQAPDTLLTVLKYLLFEVFTTAALFGALVSVWVIAKPRWAGRLLHEQFPKTMLFLVALGPIMIVFALLASRT